MKKRILALMLSVISIMCAVSAIFLTQNVFADGIDEDKILGYEKIPSVDVVVGSSASKALSLLPKSAVLKIEKDSYGESEILHSAKFEESDWTLFNKDSITIDGSKLAIDKASSNVKALTGGEYDDFVLETTIKGTSSGINNNFGVMLRAEDVTEESADSYNGYYVGIGKNDGAFALVVGYADGRWHLIKQIDFDYQTGKDYALKVLMAGDNLAVWLDGELMYSEQLTLFDQGRVGVRTYRQLFECSSFEVRTPSKDDLAAAGIIEFERVDVELDDWSSDSYNGEKVGKYMFKAMVKGTKYEVEANVNVVEPLEINEEMKYLSYENVNITEGFFREYIKQMICKVVPTAISNVEKGTGGMQNIINAAKKHRGESHEGFSGMFYVDSDVHKVLESMCYALAIDPYGDEDIIKAQKAISDKLEEWIPYYVDAQEESGYFDTYYILKENEIRFSDVSMHELYCMGHFIEAAIAHYELTEGKDYRLIEVAIKCADYLSNTFGNEEGQRKQIGGHQEIEIALLKLARTMLEMGGDYTANSHKYANLATFFLEVRGDYEKRTVHYGTFWNPQYWQDHAKVEDQTSAVGHSVRAQYMYTAMAELAAIDSEYREKYDKALTALWEDVTYTKQYVTGGVGQSAANEGFLDSYILPNSSAYCETCAGISNMMWNRSMSKLYLSSEYADIIETDIYNAVIGCVNFDGDKFYYVNALESASGDLRNAWYGTACCPPNLTRTILSLGGYIYNYSSDTLYVNQYISNEANVTLNNSAVKLKMVSGMPWNGNGSITLSMKEDTSFKLCLRMPDWSDKVEIKINGKSVELTADKNGYIVIEDKWSNGDTVEFEFSMPVIFEETDEKVTENIGYTAIRRGPIVYCAENADNKFNMRLAYIDKQSTPEIVFIDNLDGKADPYGVRDMYIIKMNGYVDGIGSSKEVEWTFIPFYARLNRTKGHMTVYVAKEHQERPLEAYATPSASYTYGGDSVYNLNDGSDSKNNRWTSWKDGTPELYPWVQYDFDEPVLLSGCDIWWYDDNGGVRLPDSFEIYYKNSETDAFTKVEHDSKYLCNYSQGFKTYKFDEVEVTSLRIVINNSKAAAGIVEWKLIGAEKNSETPIPSVTPDESVVPEIPEVTETPKTPDVTDTPVTSEVTEAPETSEATENGTNIPETTTPSKTESENSDDKLENSVLPVILGAIAAVAVAAGAVVAVIAKKKKK